MRCVAFAALVALAILGMARAAGASSALVALIPSAVGSPAAELVLSRTRGELVADGFHVVVVEPAPEPERLALVTRVGREAGAAVTVGLALGGDGTTVSLYLVDGSTGRAAVRTMEDRDAVGGQGPEVIARHHVDRLRAALLDFLVENLRPQAPLPASTPKATAPLPPPPSEGIPVPVPSPLVALEAGLGVLGGFDGVGPAVMPVVRARYRLERGLHLRVTAAWLGTQPQVAAPGGTASVDQGLALIEILAQLAPSHAIRPAFSLGTGVFHADVTGHGTAPNSGIHTSAFAFALDAGAGVVATIAPHVEVAIEAHAMVTAPGIAIRFLDADVARVGRPAILGTMSLTGWI